MKNKYKRLLIAALALLIALGGLPQAPYAGAADSGDPFEPITLTELENGEELYGSIEPFIADQLELSEEDEEAVTADSIYEVDLGNYPKGYTRQFISFIFNYDWIELVLVATNEDASKIALLDRAVSSDGGDMFLNTAKLDFMTEDNQIYIWTQAPYSAYESWVQLEWAGDSFYVVEHEFDDPTENYYTEMAALIEAKDIEGLIELSELDYPQYPGAYEAAYTLAAPALKLAHQKALAANKANSTRAAVKYLEYGLAQYASAFDIEGYAEGDLMKADITGNADSLYAESRLTLSAYAGILNDYGYFLSVIGQNKKAKPVLANVVQLVPSRTVAYLNLADVEWALGQRSAAKSHYKIYWKQLGSKASSVAPKRVQERINAK